MRKRSKLMKKQNKAENQWQEHLAYIKAQKIERRQKFWKELWDFVKGLTCILTAYAAIVGRNLWTFVCCQLAI